MHGASGGYQHPRVFTDMSSRATYRETTKVQLFTMNTATVGDASTPCDCGEEGDTTAICQRTSILKGYIIWLERRIHRRHISQHLTLTYLIRVLFIDKLPHHDDARLLQALAHRHPRRCRRSVARVRHLMGHSKRVKGAGFDHLAQRQFAVYSGVKGWTRRQFTRESHAHDVCFYWRRGLVGRKIGTDTRGMPTLQQVS